MTIQINIDPTIGSLGRWAEGVRRANNILGQLLERSFEPITASWELTHDQRHTPLLNLTLSDSKASVAEPFTAEELEDGEKLWFRLNRVWDDLLRVRLHQHLDRIRALLEESSESEDAR